jgi:hypothetical protein
VVFGRLLGWFDQGRRDFISPQYPVLHPVFEVWWILLNLIWESWRVPSSRCCAAWDKSVSSSSLKFLEALLRRFGGGRLQRHVWIPYCQFLTVSKLGGRSDWDLEITCLLAVRSRTGTSVCQPVFIQASPDQNLEHDNAKNFVIFHGAGFTVVLAGFKVVSWNQV